MEKLTDRQEKWSMRQLTEDGNYISKNIKKKRN